MAKTIQVTVRLDEESKKKCDELFDELGLSMTTAINIFLRQTIMAGGLPFEVKKVPAEQDQSES